MKFTAGEDIKEIPNILKLTWPGILGLAFNLPNINHLDLNEEKITIYLLDRPPVFIYAVSLKKESCEGLLRICREAIEECANIGVIYA